MALVRTVVESPLGALTLDASDDGLRGVRFDPGRWPAVGPAPETAAVTVPADEHPVLAAAARELAGYFAGTLHAFDLPLDLRVTRFQRDVLDAMAAIPYGQVWSYADLARRLGRDTGSARAIGRACNSNPVPIVLPCHRVVAADGSLGGYAAGLEAKRLLLGLERGEPAVPDGGWEPASARRTDDPAMPHLF
jgi:methylated-DNA-[protein]-cysteine S-methyltransferase